LKALVEPVDEKRRWVFKAPQDDALLADALAEHMAANGVKSVGFIGYTDGYGQGWLDEVKKIMPARGIKLVAEERFQRTDTSVTAQALKVVAANPDAVLIAASGTVAAMPQKTLKEQGYSKPVYQTGGVATMEFVRVGGKDVENTVFPAGPVTVAELLPDSHPSKKISLDYIRDYEALNKQPFAAFGAHLVDCASMMYAGLKPALEKAKPGTPEFRAALRDGIEASKEIVALHGVYNFTAADHAGLDKRGRVLVKIVNSKWTLLP
jgi:branched-chain amino acid transport system substrate-binding protein